MKNHFEKRCNTPSIKKPTTLLPTEQETEMGSHEEENGGGEMSMTIIGIRGIRKTPAIWFLIFISLLLLFFSVHMLVAELLAGYHVISSALCS